MQGAIQCIFFTSDRGGIRTNNFLIARQMLFHCSMGVSGHIIEVEREDGEGIQIEISYLHCNHTKTIRVHNFQIITVSIPRKMYSYKSICTHIDGLWRSQTIAPN